MRIALICTEKLPVPSIRGGAIQILIDGVSPYLRENHELTVFCTEDIELQNHEYDKSMEYIRLPKDGYPYHVANILAKRNKSSEAYDLVHVFNRPRDLLVYKSASPSSRFVLSLHNEMFKEGKISYELGSLVVSACDRIMTVSNYIKHTIIKRFPSAKEKTYTIYSGVDLNRYHTIWEDNSRAQRQIIREKLGLSKKKVILFVGRLSKVKGVDILIQALSQVQKKYEDIALVIVGSKWFSDDSIDDYGMMIREMAMKLDKPDIIFTGFIQPSSIPEMFLAGDIFVCSSQWQEPLARVHYEAMAAGLAIITTNRGGNAEIFENGKNGMVIDEYSNPTAFADKLVFLLENQEIALQIGRNARQEAEFRFGFQHVCQRLSALYTEAMGLNKGEVSYSYLTESATEVLKYYPVVFDQVELITYKDRKTVWRVQSSRGNLILKRIAAQENVMRFMSESINHLIAKGCHTPAIITAYSGDSYVYSDGFYYILFNEISGYHPKYDNKDDLKKIVEGLAYFHKASDGMIYDECNISTYRTQKKYVSGYEYLISKKEEIHAKIRRTDYDQLFIGFVDEAIKQCEQAEKHFSCLYMDNSYINHTEKDCLSLCHKDYTAGNVIIDENGVLFIYDMDSITIDHPAIDIRKLLNKIMKEQTGGWDSDTVKYILKVYHEINPLSEYEYLLGELQYPHLFIEQAEKFYSNKEPDWTFEKYISQLNKAIASEASKNNVLRLLAEKKSGNM